MKNNFLKLTILLMGLFTFLISPVQAMAATLSLSPASGQANQGCTFPVDILIDTTGTQTDGSDVLVNYEPTKFSANISSIVNGKVYQDYPGNSIDQQAGKISISGISSVSAPFNGKGVFATINFTVLNSTSAGGSTTVRFDFDPNDKTKTTDTNVVERGTIADVLSQVTDGTYTIGTGNCGSSSTPGASVASTSFNPGTGAPLPIGNSSDSAIQRPTTLPQGGLFDNTILLISVGGILTVLGVIGLVLL